MSSSQQQKLDQALKKKKSSNPLDEVKAIRKEQLDRCAIKRSEEIEEMLNQSKNQK